MKLSRENIINTIFPRHCIICETQWAYLCTPCKKTIQPHPEICPYCHKYSKDYTTCRDCCVQHKPHVEGIIIPFIYTKVIKTLIIKLKYFHKKDIASFLAKRISIALSTNTTLREQIQQQDHQTYITFIPSHRRRKYMTKGYNQAEILAKNISAEIQIPYITIANKYTYTKTQASLKRQGRLQNLHNVFHLHKNLWLKGNETILIIDDITTTGATIYELAKTIRAMYPKIHIRGIVIGRHI